jgi:hypothetical protein
MAFGLDQILGAMGTPDPYQEAKDYSAAQTAQNAAALGNPAAPPASPDGSPAAAVGANTLPPGQTPQATKTPQDMGSIIVDLTRREQANQLWNQSLGMGVAAFAQPRDREAVSKMFNRTPVDANKLGESIMAVNSAQQGQDRMNQLLGVANLPTNDPTNQLGQIAKSLNMDPQALAFMIKQDPAKAASLISAGATPTPQMANIEQINRYIGGIQQRNDPNNTPAVLTMIKNAMLAGMGGPEAEGAISDALAYKNRTGKDAPWVANGQIDQGAYKQFQAVQAQKNQDRVEAGKTLASNEGAADELRTGLEQVRDSPALQGIMNNYAKQQLAISILKDPDATDFASLVKKGALSSDEARVLATLKRITGESTATALHSLVGTGTRVTQQEVGPLKDSISSVLNLNQDYDSYVHNAINPFITKVKKTIANSYGASGNLTHMDPELEPWLHSTYRKGGELEANGSADIPDLQPAPADKIAKAKQIVADHPVMKDDILDNLQQQGFDVTKYRHVDPSTWK